MVDIDMDMPGYHQVRQWEADLILSFIRAIDIIVENVKPDLVIHSGDLFDISRPTARVIHLALSQFQRLSSAGIPVLIIEGNHSYPSDRTYGHVLELLTHIEGVRVVWEQSAPLRIANLCLHTLPHRVLLQGYIPTQNDLSTNLPNILVAHGVANGLPYFRTHRPAPDIEIRAYASWYDYVALGHCHRFSQIPETLKVFYAGSTAMVTWNDFRPRHTFGFNVVNLDSPSLLVQRNLVETRAMHPYGLNNAQGLSATDILTFLERQVNATAPTAAYCQVIVEGIDPIARRELSTRTIEEIFAKAAGLQIQLYTREQHWDSVRNSLRSAGELPIRYTQLVNQMDGDEVFKKEVLVLGNQLLEEASDKIEAEDLAQIN